MTQTWYMTKPSWNKSRIQAVEVERETELSVFIKDRAYRKLGKYESYYPTWEAAKAALVDEAARAVELAKLALARAQSALDVMKKLTPANPHSEPK